jgi:hypothetical protein
VSVLFQSILAFVLTGVFGTWIAHSWQARAAKETRFFEASKSTHQSMVDAANKISDITARRIYAMQRLCLLDQSSENYKVVVDDYHKVIVQWNENLLKMEINVLTLFNNSYVSDFEQLQSEFKDLSAHVSNVIKGNGRSSKVDTLKKINILRGKMSFFVRGMLKEAGFLHRQMHFGVRVDYERFNLDRFSTTQLFKLLFVSSVQGEAVVRSPSDFGRPVNVHDARLGINE